MKVTLTRELRFEAPGKDAAQDAPIPCTIATNTPLIRFGTVEVLDCSPTGVDLTRAPLPLIITHDANDLAIGLVENLQATGDRVTGEVRFGTSPEALQIRADVVAGIHRSLSVGYALLDQGVPVEGGFSYRWQPYEVSIVSVPADPDAGFFRSQFGGHIMPNTALANPHAEEINALCRRHQINDFATGLIQRGLDIDRARAEILEHLAQRDRAAGGHLNVVNHLASGANGERELIINSLVARMGGRPNGDMIASTDCLGLAVRSLQMSGQVISNRESRDHILQRSMHGTSDFPLLLGTAAARVLHQGYQQAGSAIKTVARLANLPDFRSKSVIRLGGAPSLEKVNENGEFHHGTVDEKANGWKLATFGRIIALSRQALINDDLSGFASLLVKFGQAAARREADDLTAILTSPPTIDGAALFDASRNTQAVAPLALAGLGVAVAALRRQTDLDGGLVTQEPATLLVPSALEMTARQLAATFMAAQSSNVQPFVLGVAVEPRLDAISATTWYLVAGDQTALEYGYLDGAEGVQIEQQNGFEIDGLQIKARLDFGCGWVAPVGWVKATAT